jgi:flavin reductase (DIM6/NTAB) family NADH-FMN oxidoreductase RutF
MTWSEPMPFAPFTSEIVMPQAAVPRDHFREIMQTFPSAVAVITALDESGLPRGLTCSAFCSLTMDPPAMLICVNRHNGSLKAIRRSGGFVANLLRAGRHRIARTFASPVPDKYSDVDWRPSPKSNLPWFPDDALAFVECKLIADVAAGTHAILIGLVEHGGVGEAGEGPLVYWHQNFGRWEAAEEVTTGR